MKEKINLLIIDAQEDFCNPNTGTLYVKGAENDCKRIANFINTHGDNIEKIILTCDWHTTDHCSFSETWGEENKIISTPMTEWLDKHGNPSVECLPGSVGDNFVTWPRHCVMGTTGAEVQKDISDACDNFKTRYPEKEIIIFHKGCNGEEYSPFARCEFEYAPSQLSFLRDNTTPLYIVGEAADVCVKNSLYHLINRYDMGENITVCTDCMSAVDEHFSFDNDEVYQSLVAKGGELSPAMNEDYKFIDSFLRVLGSGGA